MYIVIGGLRSRTFRVLWMLEEIGVPYEHYPAAPRSEDVTRYNPSGKIPVLLDGDTALTDSTAIMTYLADRHDALTYPAGTLDRARQDGLTHFILDEMDALLWTAARHGFILPEDKRVPAVKDSLKWEYERSLARLAEKLGDGPFLMGDKITLPDLLATHCANWAISAKFPEPTGALADYFEAMRARPAFQRVNAL